MKRLTQAFQKIQSKGQKRSLKVKNREKGQKGAWRELFRKVSLLKVGCNKGFFYISVRIIISSLKSLNSDPHVRNIFYVFLPWHIIKITVLSFIGIPYTLRRL